MQHLEMETESFLKSSDKAPSTTAKNKQGVVALHDNIQAMDIKDIKNRRSLGFLCLIVLICLAIAILSSGKGSDKAKGPTMSINVVLKKPDILKSNVIEDIIDDDNSQDDEVTTAKPAPEIPTTTSTDPPNNDVTEDETTETVTETDPPNNDGTEDDSIETVTETEATVTDTEAPVTDNDNDSDTNTNTETNAGPETNGAQTTTTTAATTTENRKYSAMSKIPPDPLHPDGYISDEKKEELVNKWGKWHFWDGEEDERIQEDYCGKFPNRDIPGDDLPDDAWQNDAVFVNHILNDADLLITRAQEAIFTEYGHGKPLANAEMYATRRKMFKWDKLDFSDPETKIPDKYGKHGDRGNGGWTTKRSYDGLVRRLLHAIMTRDTFTIVLAGHSAAAGHGNHFRQSYSMVMHQILAPIFARLGVKLITRNMAQGGLGTAHSTLGFSSIYGNEIDLLLWDCGMTEGGALHLIDLFARQGLLSGNRVPVIWGGNFDLLKMLHEKADVDVGDYGLGVDGIDEITSAEQALEIPWSARYLKCSEDAQDICKEEDRFCSTCWIPRDDGIEPKQQQYEAPHGRVKWHPGWREHKLRGRVLTFTLLDALQSAVQIFSEETMAGPPLADEFWHVTDYYNNIREKVLNLSAEDGECSKIASEFGLPLRLCNTPLKGHTQYTPRANFDETSLTSIIKPADDGYVPRNDKTALYDGPDAHNPCFDLPEGEIDVYAIVSARRRRLLQENSTTAFVHMYGYESSKFSKYEDKNSNQLEEQPNQNFLTEQKQRQNQEAQIVPGKGWEVIVEPQGYCDGTYEPVCARSTDNYCVLYGHHDERGVVIGNELSGWLVMELNGVENGIIMLKLHTWQNADENPRTHGWTSVNNEPASGRRLDSSSNTSLRLPRTKQKANSNNNLRSPSRYHHHHHHHPDDYLWVDDEMLSYNSSDFSSPSEKVDKRELWRNVDTPELPDEFVFEYAINGKITSLDKTEFLAKKMQVQRVVEVLTLLDDPDFTATGPVEVAIRMVGCGRTCTFGVSHIYYS